MTAREMRQKNINSLSEISKAISDSGLGILIGMVDIDGYTAISTYDDRKHMEVSVETKDLQYTEEIIRYIKTEWEKRRR